MNNYAIVHFTTKGLITLTSVRTIEEAYDMLRKWLDYLPGAKIDIMEIA